MPIDYSLHITSFIDKFKKTKVLNETVSKEVYSFLLEKNKFYADFIKQEGFCTYMNGLFSTVNPFTYAKQLKKLGHYPEHDVPVIKTAFGDFVFCSLKHDSTNYFFYSAFNRLGTIGTSAGYLFTFNLTDAAFRNSYLKSRLFTSISKKEPALNHDECFAFSEGNAWDKKVKPELAYRCTVHDYLNKMLEKHGT